MKANYPKALWVAFNGLMKPCDVGKVMCKGWYFKRKLYYLHPGNEVKLKRENAMMRDTLKALWDNRHVLSICINVATWEYIERKLPDLFKAKRRGSK